MKTLHLDSGREMRGGQHQVLYLLRGLRDRGHAVRLLARRGGPLLDQAIADAIDTRELSASTLLLNRGWADVVHAHDARAHAAAAWLAGNTLVVSRRVAFPVRRGIFSRLKYAQASQYIAISATVAEMLRTAGIKSDRISVVYDGVPLDAPMTHGGKGLVIAPATGDPMKGSDLARDAARAGGFELRFSTDLSRDLASAAVMLYVTRSEGLGSGALLAMARGVPVVASRTGGLVEVMEDGVSGLLVDNDAKSIAAAVRSLLVDRSFRAAIGVAARRRVERQFSIDGMVDQTIQVYQRVCR